MNERVFREYARYLTGDRGLKQNTVQTREPLVESFTRGYSLLDPPQPETGSADSTYRLQINVEPARLEPTES